MPPSEAERHDVVSGHEQIPVLVVPLVLVELVTDPSVELDDEPEAVVGDIAVDHSVLGALLALSVRVRKSVRTLDPPAVAALQQRLDAVCRFLDDLEEPAAMADAGPPVQLGGGPTA